MLGLTILLLTLATHRVTRIVTRDAIPLIKTPRDAFVERWGRPSEARTREERHTSFSGRRTNGLMASLAYLWECDWCASIYVGGGLTYLAWRWTELGEHPGFIAVLTWLTTSTLTGLLAQREPE